MALQLGILMVGVYVYKASDCWDYEVRVPDYSHGVPNRSTCLRFQFGSANRCEANHRPTNTPAREV